MLLANSLPYFVIRTSSFVISFVYLRALRGSLISYSYSVGQFGLSVLVYGDFETCRERRRLLVFETRLQYAPVAANRFIDDNRNRLILVIPDSHIETQFEDAV